MKTWTTKGGCKIHHVLSGRGNAYFITSDDAIILADTGKASSFNRLHSNIEKLKADNNNISYLFLTHTHYDHCQSAKHLKDIYACKIIASKHAVDYISEGFGEIPKGTFFPFTLISKLGKATANRKFGYKAFQADILIEDDNGFEMQGIKIIETPGHSSDSISLIVNNEIAIVGDAMFGVLKNSIFPPFVDDILKMIESWEKLLNTGCELFLPGHGKEIKRELLQKEYEKYMLKYK